jgi:hypothetical protein
MREEISGVVLQIHDVHSNGGGDWMRVVVILFSTENMQHVILLVSLDVSVPEQT